MTTKRVTLTLPEDLHCSLKAFADQEGISIDEAAGRAVREGFQDEQKSSASQEKK